MLSLDSVRPTVQRFQPGTSSVKDHSSHLQLKSAVCLLRDNEQTPLQQKLEHPEVDWTKIIQRTGDQHWWFSQLLDLSYLIRFLNPSPKRGQIVEYPNRLVRRLTAKFQAILKIADSVATGNNTSRPQLNSLITSPELVASQRSRWIVNETGKWNRNPAPRLCL